MKDKIMGLLSDIRPEFDFNSSDNYIDDGYLDSFDITTLITEFENRFGVVIDGLDVSPENFASCEAMEEMIRRSEKKG